MGYPHDGQWAGFSVIRFAAGSSNLPAKEEQKLGRMANALADRPGLKVEIKGFVDKEKDPEGYRQELLSRKLHNEKFLFLVKDLPDNEMKKLIIANTVVGEMRCSRWHGSVPLPS